LLHVFALPPSHASDPLLAVHDAKVGLANAAPTGAVTK